MPTFKEMEEAVLRVRAWDRGKSDEDMRQVLDNLYRVFLGEDDNGNS